MKDAKALLHAVTAAIPDAEKVADLFAADGVVELPFLYSVGIPYRYQGREAIKGFFRLVKQLYPDFGFKPEDTHVLIETPDQVFAEYMAHTTAASTGRTIHHLFAARLVAESGKIKLLRESLNVVAAAQVLNTHGVMELTDPERVVYSVAPDYRS